MVRWVREAPFMYSFNDYLLNIYSMPGAVPVTWLI